MHYSWFSLRRSILNYQKKAKDFDRKELLQRRKENQT